MKGITTYKVIVPYDEARVFSAVHGFKYYRHDVNDGGSFYSWTTWEYAQAECDVRNRYSNGLNQFRVAQFFIPEGAVVTTIDENTLMSDKIVFRGVVL